ncbi:two-component sensor histidine kinase [Noviherbaspirillum cavernae]|uniref:histidine kinase n=1 Tax=Noviherbaspirillum cavernae TaxID=2320862 RepID=A0A418WX72_9BURK|nr:ATP-binding protein [Noviherbaspirillum cavernae]RJG04838.1 two-component sensor histidine kinase [Noviherbaspirillum cavernae]
MMRSLRIRLLLLLGIAIVAAALLQFAATFRIAMQKADTLFDYHMQQMALALKDSGMQAPDWYASQDGETGAFDFVIQVWTDDGVRVYQSRPYRTLPSQGVFGYSTVTLANGDWRIYALHTNTRVIQVAQRMESRRNRAISLALNSVWPILPASLLLFAVAWWVVTSALAPLNRIGHELANRNADSLAPVSARGVPQEVSLLVTELNSLLARMTHALQSQQQFVADAAHELRSPLTALKLQVQTLARARDDTLRTQAIERLHGGVDRASRLVQQLLSLARQDPLSQPAAPETISLTDCVEQAVGDVASFASARAVTLRHGIFEAASLRGDADSLRIMTRNLLDNAVRYAPEGGQVRIDLAMDDSVITLTIQDSGPGIPDENRSRVFDRFYRVPGTSPSGSGLGLAIVKAIADRHDASVTFGDAALGGLAVTVAFAADDKPASPRADEVSG